MTAVPKWRNGRQLGVAEESRQLRGAEEIGARAQNSDRLWRILHLGSLAAVVLVVILMARHRWFVTDEWDLWAARGVVGTSRFGLLDPHEGHLIVVPILVGRLMFSIFGLRHVMPYVVVLAIAHACLGAALWSMCRDADVAPSLATCGVGAFLLCGVGAENFLFPYQATNVFSLALVITALRRFGRSDGWTRGDTVAMGAITLASAIYGLGPVGAVGILVLGVTRKRPRVGVIVGGVPLALYALWALIYEGRTPNPRPHPGFGAVVPQLPRHVLETFARSAGAVVHSTALGATIVVLIVAALFYLVLRHGGFRPPLDAAIILVAIAAGLAIAVAITSGPITTITEIGGHRVRMIPSRTVHDTLALSLPAFLIVVDRALRRVRVITTAVAVLGAIAVIAGNWSILTNQSRTWNAAGKLLKHEVAVAEAKPRGTQASVNPILAPYLRYSDISRLQRSGALPGLTTRAREQQVPTHVHR